MEISFDSRVNDVVAIYEEAINHFATRTWQMLERYGKVEAISRLVVSPELQSGFEILRDGDRLDDTFEHIVIEYKDRFKEDVIQAAQWRLDHPYGLL
jgi:hypothetical protein